MTKQINISVIDQIEDANNSMIQDLVAQYLPRRYHRNQWQHCDALISAKGPFERTGIPADAECWKYVVEEPEQGWCFIVRAVFDRHGRLLKPFATHAVIEDYGASEGFFFASDNDIVYAVNCWLRTA